MNENYLFPWVLESLEKKRLKKSWLELQAEKYAQYIEDAKHPSGHHMNEIVVTPQRTSLGTVSSDAMLDNLLSTSRESAAKERKQSKEMKLHIHLGTASAARVLAPLVAAPAAPYAWTAFNSPIVLTPLTLLSLADAGKDVAKGNITWQTGLKALPALDIPRQIGLWDYLAAMLGNSASKARTFGRVFGLDVRNFNSSIPLVGNSPIIRTKYGDVEIDNPGLYYHLSEAGKAKNFVKTGRMRTPTEEYWLKQEHVPLQMRTGIVPGFPQNPSRAMFSQGELWFGLSPSRYPDLLVTSTEMPFANSKAGTISRRASLSKLEAAGTRRVTSANVGSMGTHTPENTSAYTWIPGYGYKQVGSTPRKTSLAFFERPLSRISFAEKLGIPRGDRNFTPLWHVANYPGYLLKILMKGSPLEKQISKSGTISINSILAQANKASNVEKEVIDKVLSEKFAGQKTIDYNTFKKAVLDELITYLRINLTEWADYGMEGLGFKTQISSDAESIAFNEATGEFELVVPFKQFVPNYQLNTFTFETPRIPYGNTTHYKGNPLGHSRTYTLPEEPNILYVMESQSDWALLGDVKRKYNMFLLLLNDPKRLLKRLEAVQRMELQLEDYLNMVNTGIDGYGNTMPVWMKQLLLDEIIPHHIDHLNHARASVTAPNPQELYLSNNYLQRQLLENLKYAAENGQTKMRYPTPETAAKIEGYSKEALTPEYSLALDNLRRLLSRLLIEESNGLTPVPDEIKLFDDGSTEMIQYSPEKRLLLLREAENKIAELEISQKDRTYLPKHQTILKKYADFPKLFLRLYKDQQVRIVTDAKGNTWYEVDVPKGFLNREWQYKQGGKMNTLQFLKNGSGIHIKESQKGSFTKYCNGKVTNECIARGKRSPDPKIRKKATFALNARHWKHRLGGNIRKMLTAAGGPLTIVDYEQNKRDNDRHLSIAENLVQEPTPGNLIRAAYHAYRGSQLGLPFSGKPELSSPEITGVAPTPSLTSMKFMDLLTREAPALKSIINEADDIARIGIGNTWSKPIIPSNLRLMFKRSPLFKKFLETGDKSLLSKLEAEAQKIIKWWLPKKYVNATSKGRIPGNDVTVGKVSEPLSGLTIRKANPVTLENYVSNPAEKAAMLDFKAANPGVYVGSTQLPKTGRPALLMYEEIMYPEAYLEFIKKLGYYKKGGNLIYKALNGDNSKNWFSKVRNWMNKNLNTISTIGSSLMNGISLLKQNSELSKAKAEKEKELNEKYNPNNFIDDSAIWNEVDSLLAALKEQNPDVNYGDIDRLNLYLKLRNKAISDFELLTKFAKVLERANFNQQISNIQAGNTASLTELIGNGISAGIGMLGKNSNTSSSSVFGKDYSKLPTTATPTYSWNNPYDMTAKFKLDFTLTKPTILK